MPTKTPLVFREAGVDPTLDEIPLKRANLKPVVGCVALVLILCGVSFFVVAGMSYASGQKAARSNAALIPSEYLLPTDTANPDGPEETPESTVELIVTVTPSETITDTPAPEITLEIYPQPQLPTNQPEKNFVIQKQYVYVSQPAPPPVVVTRQIAVTRRVVVTGQPIIITALPTATQTATDGPEETPESTAEITDEPTATASETPTETPTATVSETYTPTQIPTATVSETYTPTQIPTATASETYTPTQIPTATAPETHTPTATPFNQMSLTPMIAPTWETPANELN